QLIFQAAYAGGSARNRPYQLILDEFFHLLEAPSLARRFQTALTSLRSYGVRLTLVMHQFAAQVPPALRETILGNTDIMALFKTSSTNIHFFGDCVPEIDPQFVAQELGKSGRTPTKQEMRSRLNEHL